MIKVTYEALSEVFASKLRENQSSCEQRDYTQEVEQIQASHKLLNGKWAKSPDLNSPITERRKLVRNIH